MPFNFADRLSDEDLVLRPAAERLCHLHPLSAVNTVTNFADRLFGDDSALRVAAECSSFTQALGCLQAHIAQMIFYKGNFDFRTAAPLPLLIKPHAHTIRTKNLHICQLLAFS